MGGNGMAYFVAQTGPSYYVLPASACFLTAIFRYGISDKVGHCGEAYIRRSSRGFRSLILAKTVGRSIFLFRGL